MKHLFDNYDKNPSLIFYGILSVVAFGLNWIWEIGQMFAYDAESGDSWTKSFLFCTLASVADAIVTVAIYELLKKIGITNRTAFYSLAAAFGAILAVGFELFALRFELWNYNRMMPVIPILGTGFLPIVQLILLIPLAIWLAKRFFGQR